MPLPPLRGVSATSAVLSVVVAVSVSAVSATHAAHAVSEQKPASQAQPEPAGAAAPERKYFGYHCRIGE